MRIDIKMEEWDNALAAIRGPGEETVAALTGVLLTAFAESQAIVHVQTSSLKLSGRTSSERGDDTWSGEITYGGPSGGVHDPVDYAEAERGRGGSHDYLRNADLMDSAFLDAMYASMKSRMKK